MQEVIKIGVRKIGAETINAVNARDLHEFLEVGKVFAAWMPEQIEAFGFLEHQDFEVNSESGKNPQGGRPTKDYLISIPMAKELAMVQRTPKGKEARLYFIECERRMTEARTPQSYLEALKALVASEEEKQTLACQVKEMAPKAEFHDQVATADDGQSIAAVAKVLGTGQNRLFEWLYQNSILMRESRLPYQRFLDQGYFRVVEQTPWTDSAGSKHVPTKTLVTGKGIIWIEKNWREMHRAKP